jgi:hypothetical protein
MMWKYTDMEASASRPGPPPEAPRLSDANQQALRRRSTIAGTSEQIVENLLGIRGSSGVEVEFVARSFFPTMDYEQQVELMERLATEVAPHI